MPMILPALSAAVIAAVVWRTYGAWRVERATAARLRIGPDGIIPGAEPIELETSAYDGGASDGGASDGGASDGGAHDAVRGRAVLLLHGFGDTPQTLRYLADDLHARGYAVRAPLLPGHGRTLRAFAASCADEWVGSARAELAALRTRYDRVSVVGLSMGGAIASILAAELAAEGSPLPALVLIAPYLDMPASVRRAARWHRALGTASAYVSGRSGEHSIHDDAERAKAISYRATTPRLLAELAAVADRARGGLSRITAPTLVIQSREDNRIAPEIAERAFAALGAREKRLAWLSGCGHVVTVDRERERVFALVREWLDAHAGSEAAGDATSDTPGVARGDR
ncbi:MAG: alpha/beta fold hydrolase [Gemmatimonadaceae bacterium]